MEELLLSFEEIKVTYTECDSNGQTKGNVEYNWKVEKTESRENNLAQINTIHE